MLARFEKRYGLGRDMNGRASPRIAADPRRPMLNGKRAKTAEFDSIAALQSRGNFIENGTDNTLYFPVDEMRMPLRKPLDQF
jgi:hypothetical protein